MDAVKTRVHGRHVRPPMVPYRGGKPTHAAQLIGIHKATEIIDEETMNEIYRPNDQGKGFTIVSDSQPAYYKLLGTHPADLARDSYSTPCSGRGISETTSPDLLALDSWSQCHRERRDRRSACKVGGQCGRTPQLPSARVDIQDDSPQEYAGRMATRVEY